MLSYLLERGESERREGGWEPPRAPPPLLRVRRPGDLLSTKSGPRAPEVRLGLSEQPNPSYTYAKVRLGRSWSAKVSKSAQDTSWRFLTSKCCLWTDEYSLLQKVDFRKEIIFRSLQKIINFCQMRFGVYFTDVWGGSERSKRAKSLKWHLFTTWRSKMTQVLQPLCFPR